MASACSVMPPCDGAERAVPCRSPGMGQMLKSNNRGSIMTRTLTIINLLVRARSASSVRHRWSRRAPVAQHPAPEKARAGFDRGSCRYDEGGRELP